MSVILMTTLFHKALSTRAVRLINFAPFRSHAVPYFLHSNIMPITMLYFKLSSMLMFDVYNNTASHNISHLFIPTQQIHSYSTRFSSSGNYYISHSGLNQKNDSFSIMGAKIGIVYLKIYQILQNLSLRKKFIQFCCKYLKFRIDMLT